MTGKLKAAVLLAVMFALGVTSGISWQTYRYHHFVAHGMYAERRIKKLTAKLHLTADQETTVRDIFHKAHERATKVNDRVSEELAAIHRDSITAIRQILTPEQAKEFEKLHQKFHTKHQHLPADDLK